MFKQAVFTTMLVSTLSVSFATQGLPTYLKGERVHMGAKVIAVLGKTEPLAPFYAHMSKAAPVKPMFDYRHFKVAINSNTPGLTEGKVDRRRVNLTHVVQPIFIVGTDKASMVWLKKYKARLKGSNAIGFVVNTTSATAYQAMAKSTGLHMMPMAAAGLVKAFHIHHYPVLISRHWIEQ